MKCSIMLAAACMYTACTYAQNSTPRGEFAALTANGLMYSDGDMKALRFVVDSLNLRFKNCDLNQQYYAQPQSTCMYIRFLSKTNNLQDVIRDIKTDMPFDRLVEKHKALIDKPGEQRTIIMGKQMDDRKKEERVYYLEGSPAEGYDNVYIEDDMKTGKAGPLKGWVYSYSGKDQYSSYYNLSCRYFTGNWDQKIIPEKYARLIQYVDCMIDTASYIFLTDKYDHDGELEEIEKKSADLSSVAEYIDKKAGFKHVPAKTNYLDEKQMDFAQKNLLADNGFRLLVSEAADKYSLAKRGNTYLESLAISMGMYDKALKMKRSYQVMGMCSQDGRPREHARDIAKLAAQSHNWSIFLRAHLDIMNDRFTRAIDGSYAWDKRETYLKELEELNLNVIDLMLGLTLRAENVAGNHYYGTIWRLGKALAESKDKELFEQKAIAMMKDVELDSFNKGLVYMLYTTYAGYLPGEAGKEKREYLRTNAASFPSAIQDAIAALKEPRKEKK